MGPEEELLSEEAINAYIEREINKYLPYS